MMLATLLALAASSPQTAVDAERAFAADAKNLGQWTAFRKWAHPDAVLFRPQPVNAQAQIRDHENPAQPWSWSPAESYVSCDGKLAVNTGPVTRPEGGVGYFTTVWSRQADGGWKWMVDHGDRLVTARPAPSEPIVRHASCDRKPRGILAAKSTTGKSGNGRARDNTLFWSWAVEPDSSRVFFVLLWTGERYERVLIDRVAAPTP